MLPELPADLREAQALGVALFAGEAEGRLDVVLRDACDGTLKPLYNFMNDLPAVEGAPIPILSARGSSAPRGGDQLRRRARLSVPVLFLHHHQRTGAQVALPLGRRCRAIVRANLAHGVTHFFITDDNLARNKNWEPIFDRLIQMRRNEKLAFHFVIEVDRSSAGCRVHREGGARGVEPRLHRARDINPEACGAKKKQNRIAEYREMLLAWKAVGCLTYAGFILGFPGDTPEFVRDIEIIRRELPLDLLEFFCLTPLPGSEDHQRLTCCRG